MKKVARLSLFATLSLLLVGASLPVAAAEWGDLKVRFTYDGQAPAPSKIAITKDAAFCGKFDLVDESLVVNKENNGIKNVAVYLYLGRRDKPPVVHPSYKETASKMIPLDNDHCRFEPHILMLRTSQTLSVLNSDTVGHNTNVTTLANAAQNVLIPAGGKVEMKFSQEERVPSKVACNIHPWMGGYIIVRDNPYGGVSDEDGNLVIKNIPAGKWTFQFWHEKSGYVDEGKQDGKNFKWRRGRHEVEIKPGENDLGELKLKDVFNK